MLRCCKMRLIPIMRPHYHYTAVPTELKQDAPKPMIERFTGRIRRKCRAKTSATNSVLISNSAGCRLDVYREVARWQNNQKERLIELMNSPKRSERGLTPEEKNRAAKLREAYLKDFRAGFAGIQIEHTQVFDKKAMRSRAKVQKNSTRTWLARRLVFQHRSALVQ